MNSWSSLNAPMAHFTQKGKNHYSWLVDDYAKNSSEINPEHIENIEQEPIKELVISVAGNSPYLAQLIEKFPKFTIELFSNTPNFCLEETLKNTYLAANEQTTIDGLKKVLRHNKSRIALLTAFADVGGLWTLDEVTNALSRYADLALELSLGHLLLEGMNKNKLPWPKGLSADDFLNTATNKCQLIENCGYSILALGKLGGNELNYSSDIDLIALYEQQQSDNEMAHKQADYYVKMTKKLIDIISKPTADGYVFRTDFRLRPDPGATPLAISVEAAEVYYQSIGQNWERSAMIKARPCAGDKNVGSDFLERLTPFIWRRNLDFAAIHDIHNIKAQLHAFHQHGKISIKGHDIKIGYGGIREIEFTAQIQQLIYGGRTAELRARSTIPALNALKNFGKLSDDECEGLKQAYEFLRTVEHRLQMINDEQTHQIPVDDDALLHLSCFLCFHNLEQMQEKLLSTMHYVATLFAKLSGGETDENVETIDSDPTSYLTKLKFENIDDSVEIINRWRSGRYRALKTDRGRELFEKCLPQLLTACSQTSSPKETLARFDDFLTKIPSGVQLFSLFDANPWLFKLIAKIMGSTPMLAQHLARRPALLDTLLDPQFFKQLPNKQKLEQNLDAELSQVTDYQDFLDVTRLWLNDRRFEIGVHILEGTATAIEAQQNLTILADVLLSRLIPKVEADFAEKYGKFENGHFIVIAMGSFGSEKLTFTSDLDMIFLYQLDDDAEASTIDDISSEPKQRSLAPSKYYSRLGQHIITAITAHTGTGHLYNVDMRLRPSGNSGPMVVATQTFANYQNNEAWAWEHMALTKARVLHANKVNKNNLLNTISKALLKKDNDTKLLADIKEMHEKIVTNTDVNNRENIWNISQVKGGQTDLEFILQYLVLKHCHSHPSLLKTPDIRSNRFIIKNLSELGLLDPSTVNTLTTAITLYRNIHGLLRLSFGDQAHEELFSEEIRTLLTKQTKMKSFEQLKQQLEQSTKLVYEIHQQVFNQKISI